MFYEKSELTKGIKHEHEHTMDEALATKIAMDHLLEDPEYYTKLKKAGLEEGAMTPLEAGMKECGCEGDCGCGDDVEGTADTGVVAPVTPSVAIFKIDTPTDMSIDLPKQGQDKLSSSGIGSSGAPKPLKTTNLEAPAEKNKVGPNKVSLSNTKPFHDIYPSTGTNADPLDHFGAQMVEKW